MALSRPARTDELSTPPSNPYRHENETITSTSTEGGARQAPGSEEADERFVESLSACLEEMDTVAAAAAAAGAAASMSGAGIGGDRWGLGRRRLRMSAARRGVVVLVGSAESLERVPASLRRCFTHEVGGVTLLDVRLFPCVYLPVFDACVAPSSFFCTIGSVACWRWWWAGWRSI